MNYNILRLEKIVFFFLPKIIKNKIVKKKRRKDLLEAQRRAKRTKVSKEELKAIVDGLDIGNCDIILHSSMMSIGTIKGGVKWIVNCLFDKVNISENTILVSALPYRGNFKEYLEKGVVFDVRNAPIEMGGINEYIGSLPNARRSIHPTHSVVAVGKNAEEYVSGHHLDKTPFGINSPYYKIIKNRGKAVMFGASMDYFTCIHAMEDMLGDLYPGKIYGKKRYMVKCIDYDGKEVMVETTYHASLQSYIRTSFTSLDKVLWEKGAIYGTNIGESHIFIVDLYKYTICYLNEIKKGRTIYGKVKVTKELEAKIDEVLSSL